MLAWFAAFKARNVFVFLSLLSKTGAHRGYLLQATKVNLLAHAKSVTPPAAIFPWSSESGNEVTKTIRKRFIELGGHGKEDPVRRLQHTREGVQQRLPHLVFEGRGHAVRCATP